MKTIEINKPILDACCAGRMFYFNKKDPRVLFQDIRDTGINLVDGRVYSIHPDIKGDFTNMQFPDESFSMVIFDPPHLILEKEDKVPTGYQMQKYGWLHKDWQEVLRKGFAECFRVLKHEGFLIFKWNDTDIPISKILALTDEKPILGHRSGKQQRTHWVLFMKK